MKAHRNILILILIGILWWLVFFIGIWEITGALGRMSDPENAEKGAKAYQEVTFGVAFVGAIALAFVGSWKGVLPGTRPRLRALNPKELTLLERLDDLRDEGTLSEDEFAEQKARLLGE